MREKGRVSAGEDGAVALAAVEGLVGVGGIEAGFELAVDNAQLFMGEDLAQDDKAEGLELPVLAIVIE